MGHAKSLCFRSGGTYTIHWRTQLRLVRRDYTSCLCQRGSSLIVHSHARYIPLDIHFHCNSRALEAFQKTSGSFHPICIKTHGSSFVAGWRLLLHSFLSSLVGGLRDECVNPFLFLDLGKLYNLCVIGNLDICGLLLDPFLALQFYMSWLPTWYYSLEWHCAWSLSSKLICLQILGSFIVEASGICSSTIH